MRENEAASQADSVSKLRKVMWEKTVCLSFCQTAMKPQNGPRMNWKSYVRIRHSTHYTLISFTGQRTELPGTVIWEKSEFYCENWQNSKPFLLQCPKFWCSDPYCI